MRLIVFLQNFGVDFEIHPVIIITGKNPTIESKEVITGKQEKAEAGRRPAGKIIPDLPSVDVGGKIKHFILE